MPSIENTLYYWIRANSLVDEKLTKLDLRTDGRFGYLAAYAMDAFHRKCVKKAAQIGFTLIHVLEAYFYAINYPNVPKIGRGVVSVYTMPSQDDANDFSAARFTPIISQNPCIAKSLTSDVNRGGLKVFGASSIYFKGTKGKGAQSISVPADLLFHDEIDRSADNTVKAYAPRLDGADSLRIWRGFSNPSSPGKGITPIYADSDKRMWVHRCSRCSSYITLEWPRNVRWSDLASAKQKGVKYGRDAQFICHLCHEVLREEDRLAGQWAITGDPTSDCHGYYLSQMDCVWHSAAELFAEWYSPDMETGISALSRRENFHNFKLGLEFTDEESELTEQSFIDNSFQLGYTMPKTENSPGVAMGVDQGNDLHVVISKKLPNGQSARIHIGHYKKQADWKVLDGLLERYGVQCCVVDLNPNHNDAVAFADRHPGRVFYSTYGNNPRPIFKMKERAVLFDLTTALDAASQNVLKGVTQLPIRASDKIIELYIMQMCAMNRETVEDPKSGTIRAEWVKNGPNHFRSADMFCTVAEERITGGAGFGTIDTSSRHRETVEDKEKVEVCMKCKKPLDAQGVCQVCGFSKSMLQEVMEPYALSRRGGK